MKLRLATKFITGICDARKDLLWKESIREHRCWNSQPQTRPTLASTPP